MIRATAYWLLKIELKQFVRIRTIVMPKLIHRILLCISLQFALAALALAASREQLIEAAKREGEVVVYASMNLEEANQMIARFEQKYPFVKVRLNRTDSEKLLTRILVEARAKKFWPMPSRLLASPCTR
jgi:iron(III) transport system substrate-binding protein